MSRVAWRILGFLLAANLGLLAGAGTASAHNTLISSDPAKGSSVAVAPQQVRLTFNQPVQAGFNTVTVTGPDGSRWESGAVQVDSATVTAGVRPLGPAGEYTIGYRILSADGHPVSGSVKFILATAGAGAPVASTAAPTVTSQVPTPPSQQATASGSAGAASGDSGDMPAWPWIVGAVIALGAGVGAALGFGGRAGGDQA